jgi:hypothetical protein
MGFGSVLADPSPFKTGNGSLSLDETNEKLKQINSNSNTNTNPGKKPLTGGVKRSIRRKRKVARTKKRTVTLSEKRR